MTTIRVKLSPASIQDAIDKIDRYKRQITSVYLNRLLQRLVELGVERARTEAPSGLSETISGEVTEDGKGIIRCDDPHAPYLEFGTGTKGENSPYPGGTEVMQGVTPYTGYNTGPKIITLPNGTKGWFYFNVKYNKMLFTTGVPSSAFMWKTAQYLKQIVAEEAKSIFGS